jgi:sulfite reductase beta subunit-like hemoprotein
MSETPTRPVANPAARSAAVAAAAAARAAPDWDLVLKRNNVERLKRDKFPLEIVDEIDQLAERNYLDISEEDMVRFQWYGLYQDKPKVGYFMLRIKAPSGILTAAQYRAIGELSVKFGRDYTELSTRQNVQLHWLQIKQFREVFAAMDAVGLTSLGGCGDSVRNITGCPVAGLDAEELFDCRQELDEVVQYFLAERDYFDLPRKHKITISTCAEQCNAPEINCIVFIGTQQSGRNGYSLRVGGGLSSTPRLARDLNVFVPQADVLDVSRAILDVWRTDLRYRLSRAKARLKFLVDDYGVDGVVSAVEKQLGRSLEPLTEPPKPRGATDHLGVHPQKDGRYYIGFPVFLGQVTGEQTIQIADVAAEFDGDIRLARQQNFIITNVPESRVSDVVNSVAQIGFSLDVNHIRGASVGCTGQPLCNYAVAETKSKLKEIIERLEDRFGSDVAGLKLGVDGCPHSCAHHWVSDIGLQGTTARGDEAGHDKLEAYEIYLRGGLGENAEIGRPLLRRVPTEQAADYVERLVAAYLGERAVGETFQSFAKRKSDDELVAIGNGTTSLISSTSTSFEGSLTR